MFVSSIYCVVHCIGIQRHKYTIKVSKFTPPEALKNFNCPKKSYEVPFSPAIFLSCHLFSVFHSPQDIDEEKGINCEHNPWEIALDVKHTLFYGNVSFALGGGIYLYKQMGDYSNRRDPIFFNRIGVHYTFPKLHDLTAGIEVKAHLTKADFAEFVVSMPLRLKKSRTFADKF